MGADVPTLSNSNRVDFGPWYRSVRRAMDLRAAVKTDREDRLAALEKEVKPKGGSIFRTVLMEKPALFLLLDCTVYLLEPAAEKVERKQVQSTGFYFGLAGCTDQSIAMDGEHVSVYLANRAIGAGGGNTTGGNFRSKDGLLWEKKTDQGWQSVVPTL